MTQEIERITVIDLDGTSHTVRQAGKIFASDNVPLTILDDGKKIPDFRDGLKRPRAIMDRLRRSGFNYEARPAGEVYQLCAYGNTQQLRRIVIAAADGILDLRQHALDSGIPETELPADYRKRSEWSVD